MTSKRLDSFGGGDFDRAIDRSMVGDRGDDLKHLVGIKCTCRAEDVHAIMVDEKHAEERPYCPRCNGERWLFRDPAIVHALFTGITFQTNPVPSGWAEPGDAVLEPPPEFMTPHAGKLDIRPISQGDKFVQTWGSPVEGGQVLVRGASYAAAQKGIGSATPEEDRLFYEPESVLWCEDEDGQIYGHGDFTLPGGKFIAWPQGSRQPASDKRYSLKYMGFLEWVVFTPPGERRDAGKDLGGTVLLRRRHVHLPNSIGIAPDDRISLTEGRA